ncbi:MAG: PhoD-like phosphatase N-terminal domain-containing protein [Pseudomonadota bacterium]
MGSGVQKGKPEQSTEVYAASGEISATSVVVWGRCNIEVPSYFVVHVTSRDKFGPVWTRPRSPDRLGPLVTQVTGDSDYTASVSVQGLNPGMKYHCRATCVVVHAQKGTKPASATGTFSTAAAYDKPTAVRFLWGADLAGHDCGQNEDLEIVNVDGETVRGGYVVFDTMVKLVPDFVIHQGDNIYADNAIPAEKDSPAELCGGN